VATSAINHRLRILRAIRHKAGEALPDDTYRAILKRCAGVSSSTELRALHQVDNVLEEFRRLGIGKAPARRRLSSAGRLIWSLWQQLADKGAIRHRAMEGLRKWVEHQTGVSDIHFLTTAQESQVIESLKSWLKRLNEEGGAQ
jgi:Fe2+ or Zn2+ uptake regulation protein